MAFAGSPDNGHSRTTNNFPKFCFVWAQELKIPKMAIFRRYLKIAGKAETGGKFIGAKPKNLLYYINSVFCRPPSAVHYCRTFTHWMLQFIISEHAVQCGENVITINT